MTQPQKTITKDILFQGIGLHTGQKVKALLKPAGVNQGISFVRTDLPLKPLIKADIHNVMIDHKIPRCTSIGSGESIIHTTEHLMAVLCGLGVDNLTIEIDGRELPGLDGSGLEYLKAIKETGLIDQDGERQTFEIREPIFVERNGSSICVVPALDYRISYTLDYPHPVVQSQYFDIAVNPENFESQIAPCRTFCLESEAEELQKVGLGKGANFENTLVIGKEGVIKNKLRFPNEFTRHKILDLIGDLYLLGSPIRGHVLAVKSGHTLNLELLKKIDEQRKKYSAKSSLPWFDYTQAKELKIQDVMKILPHRYPFLLVDRILSFEPGKRAVGIKNVTINDGFFQGHFPTMPIMPGVLMIEAMAQVGGIALITDPVNKGKYAFFMSVDKVKFRKVVTPGDQLVIEVEVVRAKSRTAQCQGVVKVDNVVVAEAELMLSFVEASYLLNL